VLGTPNEEVWPGVGALPNAKSASQLPHHAGEQNLNPLQPKLGAEGRWVLLCTLQKGNEGGQV